MRHFDIQVKGKVQGVFFRASTKAKARELNINGYVQNQPDGNVYIEAEGNDDNLQKLIDWCHYGPSAAKVDSVEFEPGNVKNFSYFEIK